MLVALIFVSFPVDSFIFHCQFYHKLWSDIGFTYDCEASISRSSNLTSVVEVRGSHVWGKNNGHVKVLTVRSSQIVDNFLLNIDEFFPNLIAIGWYSGSLKTIGADDLKPFPKLRSLNLYGNSIVTLPAGLLKYSTKLESINVERNSIQYVGQYFLNGLNALNYGNFKRNNCIDYAALTFLGIPNLKTRLANNCPSYVAPTTTTTRTTTTTKPTTTTATPTTITTKATTATTKPTTNTTTATTRAATTSTPLISSTPVTTYFTAATTTEVVTPLTSSVPDMNSGECSMRCLEQIENSVKATEIRFAEVIEAIDQRIVELEMQMRELDSSPCAFRSQTYTD